MSGGSTDIGTTRDHKTLDTVGWIFSTSVQPSDSDTNILGRLGMDMIASFNQCRVIGPRSQMLRRKAAMGRDENRTNGDGVGPVEGNHLHEDVRIVLAVVDRHGRQPV